MEEIVDDEDIVPVYLKISIVEPILLKCMDKSTFFTIFDSIQKTEVTNEYTLRKYLFHLVNSKFVKYIGKRKIFILSQCGADLLHLIYVQIQRNVVDYQHLTIKVD
jgi:hypothetical protein